ncbi:metal ABC transporter ATP-binding protein [Paenibacillus agilis]|uniref:Metal ABC transporter ATP-binding protein n=1 Tax=Paenibacillus agilis TaxID=3020863 RepID=A0A559IYT7_9BACL|nr:metal ABC transporter ATP-binding protein [Paenibacillus agilis]TVX92771.1 metal ABC transporter ATP-binding protein [Paenibacillus agilis]
MSDNRACHNQVVTLDQLGFKYEDQHVFQDVSFEIYERDFVGVIGSNGAGKTTLMRLMVGLLKPTAGEVRLFNTPIQQFKAWERIGYVPQKNNFNPLFPATVMEVVESGVYSRSKIFRRLSQADRTKIQDAMKVMRIENLANKRIGQLSGGQQQRVFLARAMVNKPELLILDEPTVGIDAETQRDFFNLLQHLHEHHNMTIIMVSHDMEMVNAWFGSEPVHRSGKFSFYRKHSHEQVCQEEDFVHGVFV